MTLTPKESSLLKDLHKQESICVEKYQKYAQDAHDSQLSNLFNQIAQTEQEHMQTLDQIMAGSVPQMNSGGGSQSQKQTSFQASSCSPAEKKQDQFLCNDALSTEKFVSADYNTCIFEFRDPQIRNALNHIQKEEQEHGEQIYNYMAKNGMYQ